MIFGKFCLDVDVGVRATADAPSTTGIVNGAAYLDDESGLSYACISTAAVDAGDSFIGGFRYTLTGALRVSDVTAGIPASNSINQGILMTDDGQVCFSTAAGGTVLNGVSLTDDGAVSMAVMTFLAEFTDSGAGAVDTAVTFGGVSATFTRATTATTVLSTGLIASVATGVARSYYDPTTLTYLGYLAEGARTNICLQSEVFQTTWTNVNSAESVNAGVAPDGTTTADKLIPDTAATDGAFLQTGLTLSAAATYTFSIFAKTSGFDSLQLRIGDLSFTNSASVTYNTTTGAVESAAAVAGTWTAASSTAKQYPGGWWRFTLTATATTNAGDRCTLVNTDTGDAANGVLLWGAQIEAAAFASSYIPTTTAAVARNADVLTYPTTGWLNAAAGTIYVNFYVTLNLSANARVVHIDDTTANERIVLTKRSTNTGQMFVTDGGMAQASFDAGSLTQNSANQLAAVYEANDFAASLNGAAAVIDTSGTLPTVTILRVGTDVTAGSECYGPIRRVAYYNARLPNATLQLLTD